MTPKEKDERLDRMEQHQKLLKEKVENIDEKVEKIYNAVVGDKSMGNVGMAERIIDVEIEMEKLRIEIKNLEKKKIEDAVYMNMIKKLGWFSIAAILAFLFKEFVFTRN